MVCLEWVAGRGKVSEGCERGFRGVGILRGVGREVLKGFGLGRRDVSGRKRLPDGRARCGYESISVRGAPSLPPACAVVLRIAASRKPSAG